jgi:hypothetical protein
MGRRELFIGLVFISFVSVSSAVFCPTVSLSSGGSSNISVASGSTVTVDLSVNFECTGVQWIDFNASGDASINGAGTWIPEMQDLYGNGSASSSSITDAYGNTEAGSSVSANTTLYSFDITVSGYGSLDPSMGSTDYAFGPTSYSGNQLIKNGLTVNIPEPATILLLGTAGLFITRKKK